MSYDQPTFWPERPKNSVVMTVYLVSAKHPCRKIKQVNAQVFSRKFTWAQWNDHRHMLGATAFYTKASAIRAKIGYLTKIVNTRGMWIIQPELWKMSHDLLKKGVTE